MFIPGCAAASSPSSCPLSHLHKFLPTFLMSPTLSESQSKRVVGSSMWGTECYICLFAQLIWSCDGRLAAERNVLRGVLNLRGHVCVCVAAGDFKIRCYGEDFFMVRDMQLDCSSEVKQACYTRGETPSASHWMFGFCRLMFFLPSGTPRLQQFVQYKPSS